MTLSRLIFAEFKHLVDARDQVAIRSLAHQCVQMRAWGWAPPQGWTGDQFAGYLACMLAV